jgi:hypothetical protein
MVGGSGSGGSGVGSGVGAGGTGSGVGDSGLVMRDRYPEPPGLTPTYSSSSSSAAELMQ